MTDNNEIVKEFLNKCSIVFDDFAQLDGMLVPRDILISTKKYEEHQKIIKKIR